jgi:hypothetical protein
VALQLPPCEMPKPQSRLTLSDYVAAARGWTETTTDVGGQELSRFSINNRLVERAGEILDACEGAPKWPRTLET